MELLIDNGFDGMADAIAIMMNGAMQIERSRYLRAEPYERTEQRQSYANGYKPKTIKTRVEKYNCLFPRPGMAVSIPVVWNVFFVLRGL